MKVVFFSGVISSLGFLGLGLGQELCMVYGVFGAGGGVGGVGTGSGSDDIRRVAGSRGSLLVRCS